MTNLKFNVQIAPEGVACQQMATCWDRTNYLGENNVHTLDNQI